MGWRKSLYLEYFFYLRRLNNFAEVIRARRQGSELSHLRMRNGLTFEIVGPTRFALDIFREVWQANVYVREYAGPKPRIVVDVGSHLGFFALQASRYWPKASVFAYEPDPKNYAALQRNVMNNKVQQIRLFSEAASGMSGKSVLHVKAQAEAHTLIDRGVGGATVQTMSVETVGLKEVLARIPSGVIDFIKIDCEGSEFDFLCDSFDFVESCVRFGIVEYHQCPGRDVMRDLVDPLAKRGFSVRTRQLPHHAVGVLIFTKDSSYCRLG